MVQKWDKRLGCLVTCERNDSDRHAKLFSATFGPHGSVRPGYWAVTDEAGFSIEVSPEEYAARFVDPPKQGE